ncbi:MAG: hypothetical protein ACRDQA_14330 [Nocardioidaceae bacterium]
MAELQAGGGVVTVERPRPEVRAAYRSAISQAITSGLVPDRYALRHQGRDRGDLVIRLAPRAPDRRELDPIAVPESLNDAHPAVCELRDKGNALLKVAAGSRHRALLIVQTIAAQCGRRGYDFGLRDDDKPTFQVAIEDDTFLFSLSEEYEKREVVDPDELAKAKYAWQRVSSVVRDAFSGRLVLRHEAGYSSRSWADRKRWSLLDKLPAVFGHIEEAAATAVEKRAHEEVLRRQRRQEWEDSVQRAKLEYVADITASASMSRSQTPRGPMTYAATPTASNDSPTRATTPAPRGSGRDGRETRPIESTPSAHPTSRGRSNLTISVAVPSRYPIHACSSFTSSRKTSSAASSRGSSLPSPAAWIRPQRSSRARYSTTPFHCTFNRAGAPTARGPRTRHRRTAPAQMWCLATPKIGEREVVAAMLDHDRHRIRAGQVLLAGKGFAGRGSQ